MEIRRAFFPWCDRSRWGYRAWIGVDEPYQLHESISYTQIVRWDLPPASDREKSLEGAALIIRIAVAKYR